MGIKIQVPLDEWDEERDRDFFSEWEDVFNEMGAEKILYNSVSYWGYGGWLDIDILLKNGKVVSYEYGFDSCCDRLDYCWDEDESSCDEIADDIRTHITTFDSIDQYIAWVDTLPDDIDGENERRVALKKSGLAREV